MRPPCGRNVRGSSAYRRTSTAWPVARRLGRALALCDPDLLGNDVYAGHELGDRVLDLDPAVQLEEEEVAAVEHELGRAGARVADRAPEPDRRVAHLRPQAASNAGEGDSSSTF